ncbi:MAG: M23 family metallopeptidase, partial [Frankiaceae bacterium]
SAPAPAGPAAARPVSPAAAGEAGTGRTGPGRSSRSARRGALPPEAARAAMAAMAARGAGAAGAAGAASSRPAWVRPDVGPLTSGYGYRSALGDFHPGIDLAGPYGSPIRAAAAGRISYAGPASGFGQVIRIVHPGGVMTLYGHMSRIVRSSGTVRVGEVIAYEGSEGRSTGPHLHFEVWVNGQRVDPLGFLRRHHVRI